MFSIKSSRLRGSSATFALTAAAAFFAGNAGAQQLAANGFSSTAAGGIETVVVTGTAFNPEVAPAKASLDTMEPQTIINRSYIEDSVANTADYTTILAIAPGMTGMDINGPGLSDGNVKNTMRGLPDGSFGLTYDGIPFGDTNGPTHHSESYFPGTTIGSIDVDRGPGNAGNMGASTYGGSVNMFSEALTPDSHAKAAATYGSFETADLNANYQTGDFDVLGLNNRALINFQETSSQGYLTAQTTAHQNLLLKTQTEIAKGWTLTAFTSYNGLFQHLNDSNGATASQINAYGKTFALQTVNPNLGTYQGYNFIRKKTDMDYLRLQGSLGDIAIDNTFYSYAYVNKTVTATSVLQTAADITNGVTQGLGTTVGGVRFPTDVPGYTKKNAYRVWGNILRMSEDFDFGWLTGQVRAGVWWEGSATQRARFDFDMTKCLASGDCHPFNNNFSNSDSGLSAAATPLGLGASKAKSAALDGGFAEYKEHSNWNQYEPFVELELHPFEGMTLTPGFKYVDWNRTISAPLEQKTVPVRPQPETGFTTTAALPFLMANYKIEQSWSVYAQYAQGIYVPDISAFEQKTPVTAFPKAQTTTNYQFGTVFYADNFTFDADAYYIAVKNNIVEQACNLAPIFGSAGETCGVNTGTAFYKGIEGEGTYAFDGALEGLAVFLNGSLGSAKNGAPFVPSQPAAGTWIKTAPMWTSASGLFYKTGMFKISLIDKLVGQQYSDAADSQFYKLPAYNNMDLKGSMKFGNVELGLGIYNVLNERNLLAVGINDSTTPTTGSVRDLSGPTRAASLDQYYYQPSRSFQVTLKAQF